MLQLQFQFDLDFFIKQITKHHEFNFMRSLVSVHLICETLTNSTTTTSHLATYLKEERPISSLGSNFRLKLPLVNPIYFACTQVFCCTLVLSTKKYISM